MTLPHYGAISALERVDIAWASNSELTRTRLSPDRARWQPAYGYRTPTLVLPEVQYRTGNETDSCALTGLSHERIQPRSQVEVEGSEEEPESSTSSWSSYDMADHAEYESGDTVTDDGDDADWTSTSSEEGSEGELNYQEADERTPRHFRDRFGDEDGRVAPSLSWSSATSSETSQVDEEQPGVERRNRFTRRGSEPRPGSRQRVRSADELEAIRVTQEHMRQYPNGHVYSFESDIPKRLEEGSSA